jgi:hypothetical protein
MALWLVFGLLWFPFYLTAKRYKGAMDNLVGVLRGVANRAELGYALDVVFLIT